MCFYLSSLLFQSGWSLKSVLLGDYSGIQLSFLPEILLSQPFPQDSGQIMVSVWPPSSSAGFWTWGEESLCAAHGGALGLCPLQRHGWLLCGFACTKTDFSPNDTITITRGCTGFIPSQEWKADKCKNVSLPAFHTYWILTESFFKSQELLKVEKVTALDEAIWAAWSVPGRSGHSGDVILRIL